MNVFSFSVVQSDKSSYISHYTYKYRSYVSTKTLHEASSLRDLKSSAASVTKINISVDFNSSASDVQFLKCKLFKPVSVSFQVGI